MNSRRVVTRMRGASAEDVGKPVRAEGRDVGTIVEVLSSSNKRESESIVVEISDEAFWKQMFSSVATSMGSERKL